MQNIYGVLDSQGVHIDVSVSEKAAKIYATIHGYSVVTIRYNCGYNVDRAFTKVGKRWVQVN